MVIAGETRQGERLITFWASTELVQVFVNRDIGLNETVASVKTGAGIFHPQRFHRSEAVKSAQPAQLQYLP
jgi:hypothetical protein